MTYSADPLPAIGSKGGGSDYLGSADKLLQGFGPPNDPVMDALGITEIQRPGMNYQQVLGWQNWLVQGGYWRPSMQGDPGNSKDPLTRGLTAQVIKDAHALGYGSSYEDLTAYLQYKIAADKTMQGAPKRAPFVAGTYTSPTRRPLDKATLEQQAYSVFQDETGKGPSKSQLAAFEKGWRSRENQFFGEQDAAAKQAFTTQEAQRQKQYQAGFDQASIPQYVGGGGESSAAEAMTVGRLPSPAAYGFQQEHNTMPAQGYRAAKAGLALINFLHSGGQGA